MPDSEEQQADFGYRRVPIDEKQELVSGVFRSVAGRYDLMNDLMSLGLHRAWKDALVTAINPPKNRPFMLLDIAGGTGDVALRALVAGGGQTPGEACGVLKIGGRFLCLELSTVDVPGLQSLYDCYSFRVTPTLGGIVAGDAE